MSTDYGVKCLDCKVEFVPNNMRYEVAKHLAKQIFVFASISKSIGLMRYFSIRLQIDECDEASELLEFAEGHYNHHLILVDEYDSTYDEQDNRIEDAF